METGVVRALVSGAVWLAGCTAPHASLPEEAVLLPGGLDLAYVLTLQSGAPLRVAASLTFRGSSEGATRLCLEGWASVEHPGSEILDLRVTDAEGRLLATTHPDQDSWIVGHVGADVLRATWTLFQRSGRAPIPGNEFRTLTGDDWFQMIGTLGLVHPAHLGDGPGPLSDPPLRIGLEWRGFGPRGFECVSSFGRGPGPFTFDGPLAGFRHSLFLAGKVRLLERSAAGGRLVVAVAGDDWDFDEAEWADLVQEIIRCERDFFADPSPPYFLVTLVPHGPRRTEEAFQLGGTGLRDAFAIFLSPGTTLAQGSADRRELAYLLAHEHFHCWKGAGAEQPEELVYWFSEGFTDFYARRLLLRAGLWSLEDYRRDLNQKLAGLWANPERNRPNARIAGEFWRNPDVGALPLHRGTLVALALDHELRRRSNGQRSLDDFMRVLVADTRASGARLTCAYLMARIQAETDEAFADRLRATLVAGEDPPLSAGLCAPVLRLDWAEESQSPPSTPPTFEIAVHDEILARRTL